MDGTVWILLLFGLVYLWLILNVAVMIAGRAKRFSLRSLLIVMTAVSIALGFLAAIGQFSR